MKLRYVAFSGLNLHWYASVPVELACGTTRLMRAASPTAAGEETFTAWFVKQNWPVKPVALPFSVIFTSVREGLTTAKLPPPVSVPVNVRGVVRPENVSVVPAAMSMSAAT